MAEEGYVFDWVPDALVVEGKIRWPGFAMAIIVAPPGSKIVGDVIADPDVDALLDKNVALNTVVVCLPRMHIVDVLARHGQPLEGRGDLESLTIIAIDKNDRCTVMVPKIAHIPGLLSKFQDIDPFA